MKSLKQPNRPITLNQCTCGRLQFNYGQITLHFEPHDFIAFASAVGHLVAQYRHVQTEHRTGSDPSLHNDLCH